MTQPLRGKMIERVKAAIAEKMAPAIDVRAPYAQVMFDSAARAALEAMREPSEEMISAAMKADGTNMPLAIGYDEAWIAMIDAALAEKTK